MELFSLNHLNSLNSYIKIKNKIEGQCSEDDSMNKTGEEKSPISWGPNFFYLVEKYLEWTFYQKLIKNPTGQVYDTVLNYEPIAFTFV